jgi:hypothetical protein
MNLLSGGSSFNASTAVGSLSGMARMPQTMSNFVPRGNQTINTTPTTSVKGLYPPLNNIENSQCEYDYHNSSLSSQSMANNYSKNNLKKS